MSDITYNVSVIETEDTEQYTAYDLIFYDGRDEKGSIHLTYYPDNDDIVIVLDNENHYFHDAKYEFNTDPDVDAGYYNLKSFKNGRVLDAVINGLSKYSLILEGGGYKGGKIRKNKRVRKTKKTRKTRKRKTRKTWKWNLFS
jgi:hypothetical protein